MNALLLAFPALLKTGSFTYFWKWRLFCFEDCSLFWRHRSLGQPLCILKSRESSMDIHKPRRMIVWRLWLRF